MIWGAECGPDIGVWFAPSIVHVLLRCAQQQDIDAGLLEYGTRPRKSSLFNISEHRFSNCSGGGLGKLTNSNDEMILRIWRFVFILPEKLLLYQLSAEGLMSPSDPFRTWADRVLFLILLERLFTQCWFALFFRPLRGIQSFSPDRVNEA